MEEIQKRLVAYKIRINDIVTSKFIKKEGWEPNFIVDKRNNKISRVNVLGVVVSKDEQEGGFGSIVIDDGTNKIGVREFQTTLLVNHNVGDVINVIGKIREYGNEIYITPEIIKKVDNKSWIEFRKKEIEVLENLDIYEKCSEDDLKPVQNDEKKENNKETENEVEEEIVSEKNSDYFSIYNFIKSMDKGEGVDVEDILKKSNIANTEDIVMELLKNGEIFEIKPGRLKVLE